MSKTLVFSNVLAKTMAHLQIKTPNRTLLSLAKYVVDLGAGQFVDEYCDFHSAEINPAELTLTHTLFEEVQKSLGKLAPITNTATMKFA